MDCLFCKMANGEINVNKVYEDENILAFHDIDPKAPVHILIIPKAHISSCDDISEDNVKYISNIFISIPKLTKKLGIENGYRVVTNVGEDGGQSVKHLHFHLLGKRALAWPPG